VDWKHITAELEKKLDPAHVKPPPQGKYGDYIEGWWAIAEANRIFGFDGWSYTLDELRLTNEQEGPDGKHRVGYLARVTVCVDEVARGDVGHGQGFGKSLGDAHDSAVKEAVTDALKRALRTFGNPFGLALYDKTKANVGVDFDAVAARDRIKRKLESVESLDELKWIWTDNEHADLAKLKANDPPKFAELNKAKDDAKTRLENT